MLPEAKMCCSGQLVMLVGDRNADLSVIPSPAKSMADGAWIDVEKAFATGRGVAPSPTCQFQLGEGNGTRRDFALAYPNALAATAACSILPVVPQTSWIRDEWRPDEWNDGWSFHEWNDDRNGVGWREDCVQTHVTSVSAFSLDSSEWAKMNLDTKVVADTFPSNFGPEGIRDGSFHDWIPDGEAWQFQGYDENGFPRSLDGRLMDAYEVLNSSASASASAPASRVAGSHAKNNKTSMRNTTVVT